MSLAKDNYFLASDFINLKARVKAEMTRRNGYGSLSGVYDTAAWDFTDVPAVGVIIKEEHYDKIRDPLAAINSTTVTMGAKAAGDIVLAMNTFEANTTLFESRPRSEGANNDCSAACTGMCISQCTTSCVGGCSSCGGCDGGCSSCGGACDNDCDTGCEGTCWVICNGDCNGCAGCTGCGYCTGCSGCGDSCTGYCTGTCGDGVVRTAGCAGCDNACSARCTGCGNSCYGGCTGCNGNA